MLNTNRLRILREVHARGTITAAAEALYLTPSALSHQLSVLEREVGVPLLERTARSVRVTDAGRRLVAHADEILMRCEEALADVARYADEVTGSVKVSVFQTAAQAFALPALAAVAKAYPSLEITVCELHPLDALPALKSGGLDIALAHEWDFDAGRLDPGIERHDLLTERVSVLLPRGHALAAAPVRLRDLAHERWCLGHEGTPSRQAVESAAREAGFEPRIVFESNYFRAVAAAVEAGFGVGVAPEGTDLRGLELDVRQLAEPAMQRRVFAAVRRGSGSSPAISAVIDAMAAAVPSAY